MARIIVMPDAPHLREGIDGMILYAEQIEAEQLDDVMCSGQILERLEQAVRQEAGMRGGASRRTSATRRTGAAAPGQAAVGEAPAVTAAAGTPHEAMPREGAAAV